MAQATPSKAQAQSALDQLRQMSQDIPIWVNRARDDPSVRNTARQTIEYFEGDSPRYRETVLRWLSSVFDHPTQDIQFAILEELKMARYWARVERLLRSGIDPKTVIREIASTELEIRTIFEELPSYLRSVGGDEEIEPCFELLEDLEKLARDNEVRNARRIRRELIVGWPRLMRAIEVGLSALEDESISQIPKWNRDFWKLKLR